MPPKPAGGDHATPFAAIVLILGAGFVLSFLDTSAKYLVTTGIAPPILAWTRFAVHVVLVFLLFRGWSNPAMFRVANLPMQILRGCFLFGSTFLNFWALRTLQLAETVAIFFFAPMVITALAGPLLGEWAGWRRWLAIAVGFIGMLVVTRPGLRALEIGHLYAVGAMFSYSFYVIMTRRMSATESAESLIFYSAVAPVVLMFPAVPLYGSLPPDLVSWLVLLSLGFYGAFGHWLIVRAYRIATTSALAPYPYLQIVWMVSLGYLVFGELPDWGTMVGAGIIVGSGLYIVHRERKLHLAARSVPTNEDAELAKRL